MIDDICPQRKDIPRVVNLDKNLPREVVAHANQCDCCFFWLTNHLARNEAYFSTRRHLETRCQKIPRVTFRHLLLAAADSMRKAGGEIDKRDVKTMLYTALNEVDAEEIDSRELIAHMDSCTLCQLYFEDLYAQVLRYQERYEMLVYFEETIRPVAVDKGEEIIIDKLFVGNLSQKPN